MKIAIVITSNTNEQCPFCRESGLDAENDFLAAADHLQNVHGLQCIHTGTRTINRDDEDSRCTTVAIFGSENPPEKLPELEDNLTIRNLGEKTERVITLNPQSDS